MPPGRQQAIEHDADDEDRVVHVLAADLVRQRGPEDAAERVEQADQADQAGGGGDDRRLLRRGQGGDGVDAEQLGAEHVLQHRARHGDHADAGGDVQAQHAPDQPELRRLPRGIEMHVGAA